MSRDRPSGPSISEEGNTLWAETVFGPMDPTDTIFLEISTQLHPEQLIRDFGNLYEEPKETQHPAAERGKGILLLNL